MARRLLTLVAGAVLLAAPARGQELAAEHRALLEQAIEGGRLFDPRGARRVRATIVLPGARGQHAQLLREGWAPAGEGRPAWLLLDDLSRAPVAPDGPVEEADFPARLCEWLETRAGDGPAPRDEDVDLPLAWSAWALRLDHEELAARLLREGDARLDRLHRHHISNLGLSGRLARLVANGLTTTARRAFALREDAVALEAARALAKAPGPVDEGRSELPALLQDLERREQEGRLGVRVEVPADLETRPPAERAVLLLRAAGDIEGPWYAPADPTVQALVAVGSPAVPALLDAVERDERVTRGGYFDERGDALGLVTVKEVAYAALHEILALAEFDPLGSTAEPLPGLPSPANVRRLRAYCEANAGSTLEERLRRALLDPTTEARVRRDAAWAMGGRRPDPDVFGRPGVRDRTRALALSGPTAAEALLAALDREEAALAGDPTRLPELATVDFLYVAPLATLGDRRAAPALCARFERATRPSLRLELALACEALGAPGPLDALAARLVAREAALPPEAATHGDDRLDAAPLDRLIDALLAADRPACDAALAALDEPGHPAVVGRSVADRVLDVPSFGFREQRPCVALLRTLRRWLDHDALSPWTYELEGRQLIAKSARGTTAWSQPIGLDPAQCDRTWRARVCDEAAMRLGEMCPSLPRVLPVQRDRDARLAELRQAADALLARARPTTGVETAALCFEAIVADQPPLGVAATAEDVAAGRAVFHLEGLGVRADVPLPAAADVDEGDGGPVPALVVQAETGPDGDRVYGVLTWNGPRRVPAAALRRLCPLPPAAEQEAAIDAVLQGVASGDAAALERFVDGGPAAATQTLEFLRHVVGQGQGEARRWLRQSLRPRPGGAWVLR